MLFISSHELFLFLGYLNFRPEFLVTQENGLIRNLGLISKCMTSSTEKQIITIHMLPNISRSKDNQSRKFGQLIEYNMRKVFLEKSKTK